MELKQLYTVWDIEDAYEVVENFGDYISNDKMGVLYEF